MSEIFLSFKEAPEQFRTDEGRRVLEQYLDIYKQEIKEMSQDEGTLITLGKLKNEANEAFWTGGITLSKRIESGDLINEEVASAHQSLDQFFVPVTKGASKRCIDGRLIDGYDDNDPEWYGRPLGPQVPGGTPVEAIVWRVDKGIESEATIGSDTLVFAKQQKSDFMPGDHTGPHAEHGKTDCAAIDKDQEILAMYCGPEAEAVWGLTASTLLLAGGQLPDGYFDEVSARVAELLQDKPSYFSDQEKVLEILNSIVPNAVELLAGVHRETSLTINLVSGTTFHRDHYAASTGNKIHNFNLDAWNIIEEQGERAPSLIAYAIGAFMKLTDGSLDVKIRVPKEQAGVVLAKLKAA